ncbi:hypothetical protein [Mesorhizobium sp.]|uniref:hypothetical protein n=1 Tax=Mesorhizobium sp. TaxID=1871066 RepID=UPI00257CC725|nr:hypothetical protein [Mesorhizobium sp.]
MTNRRKEFRGVTLSNELARIIGQRLVVEPILNGVFVVCEEPAAKAEKNIYVDPGGVLGGVALDEGLLKAEDKVFIPEMKRALAEPFHKAGCGAEPAGIASPPPPELPISLSCCSNAASPADRAARELSWRPALFDCPRTRLVEAKSIRSHFQQHKPV